MEQSLFLCASDFHAQEIMVDTLEKNLDGQKYHELHGIVNPSTCALQIYAQGAGTAVLKWRGSPSGCAHVGSAGPSHPSCGTRSDIDRFLTGVPALSPLLDAGEPHQKEAQVPQDGLQEGNQRQRKGQVEQGHVRVRVKPKGPQGRERGGGVKR